MKNSFTLFVVILLWNSALASAQVASQENTSISSNVGLRTYSEQAAQAVIQDDGVTTAFAKASTMYKGHFGESFINDMYLAAGRKDILGKWHPNGTGPDHVFSLPDGRTEAHEDKTYSGWPGKGALRTEVNGRGMDQLSDEWLNSWEERVLNNPLSSETERSAAQTVRQARLNGTLVRIYNEINIEEGKWRSANVIPVDDSGVRLEERTGPVSIERMGQRLIESRLRLDRLRMKEIEADTDLPKLPTMGRSPTSPDRLQNGRLASVRTFATSVEGGANLGIGIWLMLQTADPAYNDLLAVLNPASRSEAEMLSLGQNGSIFLSGASMTIAGSSSLATMLTTDEVMLGRLTSLSEWSGRGGFILALGAEGFVIWQYSEGQISGRQAGTFTASLVGGIGGGWVGALAGASAGAATGAEIGVWFDGWGAAPGAAIGGTIGAIAGGFGGGWGGSAFAGWAADSCFQIRDDAWGQNQRAELLQFLSSHYSLN